MFENVDDYENAEYDRYMADPVSIFLNIKMEYDVIDTRHGLFLSQPLIEELQKEMVTGYIIREGILEN